MNLSNEQWNDLGDAIRENECVLLLGPNAATYDGEPLQQLLAEKFTKIMQREHALPAEQLPERLFELLKLYQSKYDRTTALENIGKIMKDFYADYSPADIPVYRLAADLPFRYIINTAPDDLMAQALAGNDRVPLFFSFHFTNPSHNAAANEKATDLDSDIADDRPLLYNLSGHYSLPNSLVLTDDDRMRFIEKIMQTDKDSIPTNIAYHFTNKPRFRMRKTYLFVGFDFNEWHLRMVMYLLRRSQEHLPRIIILQNPDVLAPELRFFYDNSFDVSFVNLKPETFLSELKERLKKPSEKPKEAAMKLLLLYHESDASLRDEFEKYLATLRSSGLVETWHEGKILAGNDIDESITQQLNEARIIVPLITANFMASDKLYEEHLLAAMQKHRAGTAKLVPVLMTPYDLYGTVFEELNTLLPKPRGKAISQKPNREEALATVATELRRIIENLISPLKIAIL